MNQPPSEIPRGRPLNQALKQGTDSSHDLESSPPPLATTEASAGDGKVWPVIWAVVVIGGLVVTLFLIF